MPKGATKRARLSSPSVMVDSVKESMKTIVYHEYGPPEVLQIREVAKPAPRKDEILVKIHATTVTIGDTIMRSLRIPGPRWQQIVSRLYLGIRRPKRSVLGMELAGEVESIGQRVTRFKVGDAVFASTFAMNFGGYAEYKCIPENGVVAIKPVNLSYEEAAAAPGAGMTALHCMRKGNIQSGQKVLIYGASGAVGTFAVQIARHHFAADVTGVCSTANLSLVKSLGADRVVDYTKEDFSEGSETYDVIFDAVGKTKPTQAQKVLKKNGSYLNVHTISGNADSVENLVYLKELIEAGKVKPVVDRCYPFEQVVDAHRYVDTGHKKGNVVITLSGKSS